DDALVEVDDVDEVDEVDEAIVPAKPATSPRRAAATTDDDEDEDDEDDELDPDDVEASLDVILKDRLVVADEDEDEHDEVPHSDERAEGSTKVLPKRPDEFVCQSCFLVKHPSQLADPERQLCRDWV